MEEDVSRVSAVDMEAPGRVANQLSIEEKSKIDGVLLETTRNDVSDCVTENDG